MTSLFRIEDTTTIPELLECLALVSRSPRTDRRTDRCDALLDEILERRGTPSLR